MVGIAVSQGVRVWLVGGVVRDLLLGVTVGRDIDLVVEGDVATYAQHLVTTLGGRLLAQHAAFGTATLELTNPDAPTGKVFLDLARARVEVYPQPAVLPLVQPASINADLQRRDFSVNAMALELCAAAGDLQAGQFLDPYAGQADLAAGVLRLLHGQSLRDDPTRILRGLRLTARLGLQPDAATRAQIAAALEHNYLGMLSAERVVGELCLALEEPHPATVVHYADMWGVTAHILPGLVWSERLQDRFTPWQTSSRQALIAAGLCCYDLNQAELTALSERYPLPTTYARLFAQIPALRESAGSLVADLRPSQIDAALHPYSESALHLIRYAEPDSVGKIVTRYLDEIRPARAPLDGRDLQNLGVTIGPAIGKMLARLRIAYLDGAIKTREQAEAWVHSKMEEGEALWTRP